MSLTPSDIQIIIDALQESDWDQASITIGETNISVARNGFALQGDTAVAPALAAPQLPVAAPVAPAAAPVAAPVAPAPTAATAAPGAPEAGSHVITAPSVGVFWWASQPGAEPFVTVGQRVNAGDTIGIVEVMKLMNNIAADVSGEVLAIHTPNAGAVEFGTPLISIRADA